MARGACLIPFGLAGVGRMGGWKGSLCRFKTIPSLKVIQLGSDWPWQKKTSPRQTRPGTSHNVEAERTRSDQRRRKVQSWKNKLPFRPHIGKVHRGRGGYCSCAEWCMGEPESKECWLMRRNGWKYCVALQMAVVFVIHMALEVHLQAFAQKVRVCTCIGECLCARHCASRAPSTLLRMPLILAAAAAAAAADRTPHI